MTTGSGLDAQVGFGAETTVGTAVTPTRFLEFDTESMQWTPQWIEPTGVRAGTKYKRASRLVQSTRTVSGSVTLQHATKGFGLLWKYALGSALATPTALTAPAYESVLTPGDFLGKSLTVQVGRPEPGGTVRPHTYRGCKVSGWTFKVSDGAIPTLQLDLDGWDEDTAAALAAATYPSQASLFNFMQTALKLGGTATTTSGKTSIASGAPVAPVVKSFELKSAVPMANQRYGLGNGGVKKEQLENGIPSITGTLEAEYDKATFYDVFKANTTTALQLTFTGAAIGASGQNDTLDFVIPASKFKGAQPTVSGPDLVSAKVDFEVYSDETNPVLQVRLVNSDATL